MPVSDAECAPFEGRSEVDVGFDNDLDVNPLPKLDAFPSSVLFAGELASLFEGMVEELAVELLPCNDITRDEDGFFVGMSCDTGVDLACEDEQFTETDS